MALIRTGGSTAKPYAYAMTNSNQQVVVPIVNNEISLSNVTYVELVVGNIKSISGTLLNPSGSLAKSISYYKEDGTGSHDSTWTTGDKNISGTCSLFVMSSTQGGAITGGTLTIT